MLLFLAFSFFISKGNQIAHAQSANVVSVTCQSSAAVAATAKGADMGHVNLKWDPVRPLDKTVSERERIDLAGYHVYRADVFTGPFNLVGAVDASTLTFRDNTLVKGTTYYYKVHAFYEGDSSDVMTVTLKKDGSPAQ